MLKDECASLRQLHQQGAPLVLGNIWDAVGARAAEKAGFSAVATTSETVAHCLGFDDQEGAPAEEMLAAAARICGAVTVPTTVDVESGYGLTSAELVARLAEMGAAGFNIEDSDHTTDTLTPATDQAHHIAELRKAADEIEVPLVINARIDVFLRASADTAQESLVDDAIARGREYLAAGADCVYPLSASEENVIGALVDRLGPINVLATPAAPDLERLAQLGVARISHGPGLGRGYETWLENELTTLAEKSNTLG